MYGHIRSQVRLIFANFKSRFLLLLTVLIIWDKQKWTLSTITLNFRRFWHYREKAIFRSQYFPQTVAYENKREIVLDKPQKGGFDPPPTHTHPNSSLKYSVPGEDSEFEVRGSVSIRQGVWGPLWGPQWFQGKALLVTRGGKGGPGSAWILQIL